MAATSPWHLFDIDPRRPDHAHLRASDRDRDVILDVLGTAFAEGRLTHDEYDERTAAVAAGRTLGELPPLVRDLVPPVDTAPPRPTATYPPLDARATAQHRYEQLRRQALVRFLAASLVCWTIFLVALLGDGTGFPWPLLVSAFTGLRWLRLSANEGSTVAALEREIAITEQRRRAVGQRPPYGPGPQTPWPPYRPPYT